MVRSLVPKFILEKSSIPVYQGSFEGLVVVIDLKGFTSLSEKMMTVGKQGVEILSQVINQLFSPSIEIIYHHQGFVSSFAGDAFTAIFPVRQEGITPTVNGVFAVKEAFQKLSSVDTEAGQFDISMRMGLSRGLVDWQIIKGNKYQTYLFSGDVFKRSNYNCGQAQENQVIADYNLLEDIHDFDTSVIDDHAISINNSTIKISAYDYIHQPEHDVDKLIDFFPLRLVTSSITGEYREVTSCFVGLRDNEDVKSKIEFILELSLFYQGYFNKVDFGDKGYMALVLFGAPWGVEKSARRAGNFSLELIRKFPGEVKIGITRGRAFTGFIGCEIREEYTGIGVSLNLAARLSQIAQWGQILTDQEFNQNISSDFNIEFVKEAQVKGFENLKKVYQLTKLSKTKMHSLRKAPRLFVGRTLSLNKLTGQLKILQNRKFAGITFVVGRAGIGKTALIEQLQSKIEPGRGETTLQWIELKCDELLSKSFNPIISYLKTSLDIDEGYSAEQNKKNFKENFEDLLLNLSNNQIKQELAKNSWIVARFLDIEIEPSSPVSDPKIMYDNFIFSVKDLFKGLALHKPLILVVDDGQWMDGDTQKLINNLIRNIGEIPLWIIICTREKNLPARLNLDQSVSSIQEIFLDELDQTNSKILINNLLSEQANQENAVIPEQSLSKIFQTTQGNPFFIEQLVYYLFENKIIDRNFNLIHFDQIDIPSNIHEIIITRIDRLSEDLKQAIQVASVLGREFAVEILTEMLKGLPVRKYLIQGEQQLVWEAVSEIKYIFKHALIREVAYQMQLKQRIIELHLLAAKIIENRFPGYSDESVGKLAYHYYNAEIVEKAEFYLNQAAQRSLEKFRNSEGLNYLNKLKNYYHKEGLLADPQNYFKILLKLKSVYFNIGQIDKYNQTVKEIIKIADESEQVEWKIRAGIENFKLVIESGIYEQAYEILQNIEKHFENYTDKVLYAEYIHCLAYYYDMICDYPQALNYYHQESKLAEKCGNFKSQARVLGNIGAIYMVRGDLKKAINYLQKQLEIAEQHNLITIKISALNNIGITNKEMGDFERALQCYQQNLNYSLENGYKNGASMSYGNIGEIYFYQDKKELALEYFQKNLYLARELGDEKTEGNILYNISIIYNFNYQYHQASEHLLQAEKIFIKYKNDLALCYLYGTLGDNFYKQMNLSQAEKFYQKKISISRKLSIMDSLANGLCGLAQVSSEKGKIKKAERYFEKAVKISQDKSLFKTLAKIQYCYADFCFNRKNYDKAFKIINQSLSFTDKMEKVDQILSGLLKAKLIALTDQNKATGILESLTGQVDNIEISAEIYFYLYRFSGKDDYREKAISLYSELVEKTSVKSFKHRLEQLVKDQVPENFDVEDC